MKNIVIIILAIISISCAYSQNVFTVTKTTDPDPFEDPYNFDDQLCDPDMYGTLQWAIRKTNDATGNCIINFNISGSAPHVISLNNILPQINNTVTIDGTSQAGYSTQNPAIIIDGQDLVYGLSIYNTANCTISGLYFKNFTTQGITGSYASNTTISNCVLNDIHNGIPNTEWTVAIRFTHSTNCLIQENIIGSDISNDTTGIENVGIMLWLDASDNNIEKNKIVNCGSRGIWIAGTIYNKISQNAIFDNTKGIVLNGGGNQNKPSPVITLYNDTIQTIYGTSQANDTIEIFGSTGSENANEYLATVTADAYGNWTTTVGTPYSYLIATATDGSNNTSELSNAQQSVTIDYSRTWVSLNVDTVPSEAEYEIIESSNDHLIVDYEVKGFYKRTALVDGTLYKKIDIPGCYQIKELGRPILPAMGYFIQVPDTDNVTVTLISQSDTTITGINICPFQDIDTSTIANIDTILYSTDSYFPNVQYFTSRTNSYREILNRWFAFQPVQFNPVQEQIKVTTQYRIRIDFNSSISYTSKHYSETFEKNHEKLFVNYTSPASKEPKGLDDYDLLIIKDSDFDQYLDDFVYWKNKSGFKTKVVDKDSSIINSQVGNELFVKMKNFIKAEYDSCSISYVLFIGEGAGQGLPLHVDTIVHNDTIPGGGLKIEVEGDAQVNARCGDYSYGCLDSTEHIDLQPEVYIGRLSSFDDYVYESNIYDATVVDSNQIGNFINKLLNYEKHPPRATNWFRNCLLMAFKDPYFVNFSDSLNHRISSFYNTYTAFGTDQSVSNYDNIQLPVNTYGMGVYNYRGHGQKTYWGSKTTSDVTIPWNWQGESFGYDAVNVFENTDDHFVVFSLACNTNSFAGGSEASLGQYFTAGTTEGAVAFFGATLGTRTSFNSATDSCIFEEIMYNYNYRITHITANAELIALNQLIDPATGYPYAGAEKSMLSYLWLGDPTMDIWTDMPQELTVSYTPFAMDVNTPTDIEVNLSNLPTGQWATICLYKENELFEKYYVSGDQNQQASHLFSSVEVPTSGIIDVTVTSHNFLPFEGEIYVGGCGNLKSDIEITANETWSTDKFVNANVIVKDGITLAITAKVCFNSLARVIIEEGGKLIIDNGELYTGCGELWKGILVEGDSSLSQTYKSDHGWLVVRNDGIIRDAKIAAKVKGGGIVHAYSGIFKNNQVDFEFEPYSYTNTSYFSHCLFLTEGQLHDKTKYPHKHVMLDGVTGIKFVADTFRNDRTAALPGDPEPLYANNKGIGILAFNSGFKVMPACSTLLIYGVPCDDVNLLPNTFENLCYGIKATSINPAVSVTIQQSEFKNNYRGVLLENLNNPTVTSNEFDAEYSGLGTNLYGTYPAQYGNSTYSMYLNACTGYKVEENTFENGDAGLFINESGDLYNEVYKNEFDNIDNQGYASALTALGSNKDAANPQNSALGLEFNCNDYALSEYNMSVVGSSTIQPRQGSNATPTGNVSDYNCPQSESDFFIDVASPILNYYYFYQTGEDLSCHSTQINQQYTPVDNTCESKLDTVSSISVVKEQLNSIQGTIESAQDDLYELVDDGDTGEMLDLINDLNSENFEEGCTTLVSIAPYLSDSVLTAFMQAEIEGFEEEKLEVLLESSPLPENARMELEDYSLPEEMMDQLLAAQDGINTVEEEMMEIAEIQSERQYLLNSMVASALYKDSLPEPTDSVINFLASEAGYKAKYYLVPLLIETGDYTEAGTELDNFETAISGLASGVQEKILDYIDYLDIVKDYRENDNDASVITNNLNFLETLAERENAPGNIAAQAMLEQYDPESYDYPEKIEYPADMESKSQTVFIGSSKNSNTGNIFKVYPNPGDKTVTVEFQNAYQEGTQEPESLEIFNIYGQKVFAASITEQNSNLDIDVSRFANGVYMFVLNKKHKERVSIMH